MDSYGLLYVLIPSKRPKHSHGPTAGTQVWVSFSIVFTENEFKYMGMHQCEDFKCLVCECNCF